MITLEEAKKKVLSAHKDSVITSIMQLKDGYLFAIKPKNWNPKEILLDPFFKVDSKGKLTEYSPVMDTKEFGYALDHVIYKAK